MSDEVDFLHVDKHESLVQTLLGMVKHSQSSQNSKFAMSLQYLKKEVKDEVGCLHADKHQKCSTSWAGIKISGKVILSLFMGMIEYFQSMGIL